MKISSSQMIAEFDSNVIDDAIQAVDRNSQVIEQVVNDLVVSYCKDLDKLIDEINQILKDHNRMEDYEIDGYILKLPIQLYYLSSAKESVGVREDTAKMIRQALYAEARKHATGTVSDKDLAAEQAVETETLTRIAYSHARQRLQSKADIGLELLSALKKVSSRRTEEYYITQRDRRSQL